jgi:hypothetical protein
VSERHPIKQLVIVAGPSGAGKSTFLRQLSTGELPPPRRSILPRESDKWPQYKVAKGYLGALSEELKTKQLNGAVLHYDLATKLDLHGKFRLRKRLREILMLSQSMTIVNITAPSDHLVAQLAWNKIGTSSSQNMKLNLWTWKTTSTIRSALSAVSRMLPRKVIDSMVQLRPTSPLWATSNKNLAKQLTKCNLYVQAGWLDALFEEWKNSLQSIRKPGVRITHLYLVPDLQNKDPQVPKWRLRDPES